MSRPLSFREAIEQRVSVQDMPRNESGSAIGLVLRLDRNKGISRPADVVRLLVRNGLSLRKGHDVVHRLARGEVVPVELPAVMVPDALLSDMADLGIRGIRPMEPKPVDVAALREGQHLTQREFAIRYGIELATLRNWEQDRNPQDRQTRVLLRIIQQHPEIVDAIIEDVAAG